MIKILLVDDQETVREAIAATLGRYPDLQVVGGVSTGPEAIHRAREQTPHVVVTETHLQGSSSIQAARHILEALPATRVLALTSQHAPHSVCQAMDANFSGYCLKKYPFIRLVEAIHAVYNGEMYLSPQVTGAAFAHTQGGQGNAAHGSSDACPLTARELQVLKLVADGRATKEIAPLLGISLKTAETHRRHIMEKLEIYSIAELTKYAIRIGLSTI